MNSSIITEYEPIEKEWFRVLNINTEQIKTKKVEEKELFELYQKKLADIDHKENEKLENVQKKFDTLNTLEKSILKRIFNEERSMVHMAYEGLLKTFGFDNDCSEEWYEVNCEYDE